MERFNVAVCEEGEKGKVNECISLIREEVGEQSGWPSVGYSQMLIREAMLMGFTDSVIPRTVSPLLGLSVPSLPLWISPPPPLFLTVFLSSCLSLAEGALFTWHLDSRGCGLFTANPAVVTVVESYL